MSQETGKWLILIGLALTLIGALIYMGADKLNWIGRLPGDIRVERENFRFYFPLTSMIVISILANLLFRLWKYFT